LERYRALRRSFESIRAAICRHVQPAAVDELFLTCLNHPDVQLLSQVIARAEVCYLPHGLGSIHAVENETCVRLTTRPPALRKARHLLARTLKRPVWGTAATPPLSFDVATAYSFNRPPAVGRL